MAKEIQKIRVLHRVDEHDNWIVNDPVLLTGELGVLTDLGTAGPNPDLNIKALVIGNNRPISENYGPGDEGQYKNVFFSGIGAGYVLPIASLTGGDFAAIGGIIGNGDYFNVDAIGVLTPKYYSIQGSTIVDGHAYANQWIFDSDVYVSITGANIENLKVKNETRINVTQPLIHIHDDEIGEEESTKIINVIANRESGSGEFSYYSCSVMLENCKNASSIVINPIIPYPTDVIDGPIVENQYFGNDRIRFVNVGGMYRMNVKPPYIWDMSNTDFDVDYELDGGNNRSIALYGSPTEGIMNTRLEEGSYVCEVINQDFDEETKTLSFTIRLTDELMISIPGDVIRELYTSVQYTTTESPLLPDHQLEGMALHNYREKEDGELSRPYAVLGIDNTGALIYAPNYDHYLQGYDDYKRITFIDGSTTSGFLYLDGANNISGRSGSLTLTPSNVANTGEIVYNGLNDISFNVPNQFCTLINNGSSSSSLAADGRTIDIKSLACKDIILNEGQVSEHTYSVSNGTIKINVPVWTQEASDKLDELSSTSEEHTSQIEDVQQDITDLQSDVSNIHDDMVASLNLDGEVYDVQDKVITAISKPTINTDGSILVATEDEESSYGTTRKSNEFYLKHYNRTVGTISTTYPPSIDIESLDNQTTKFVKYASCDNLGHVTGITLESVSFTNLINKVNTLDSRLALPESATDGTYILKAKKLNGSVVYTWERA